MHRPITFGRRLAVFTAVCAAAGLAALGVHRAGDATPPLATASATAGGAAGRPEPPTAVLVRFTAGAAPGDRAAARRAARVSVERALPLPRLQLVRPAPGVSVADAVRRLERSASVAYAEPDVARRAAAVPNAALFGQQWGLHNVGQPVAGTSGTVDADIDGPEAWDVTTGAAGITVAVVDTGMEAGHPDLAPNRWTNPGESGSGRETNGIDDDRNGYVDDVHGWDFVGGDRDPNDGNGHGTHVAGTVGARGNDGRGVAGVAWQVGLLPLRVLGNDGSGRVSDLVSAYALAHRLGIRIVNASLGGPDFSRSERDAIAAAPSTLFVVAAGNEAADNDVTGSYPCNYDLPNIVCVAAIGPNGALASFSNRGARTVDLAAPGVSITSTYLGGRWAAMDGTSMATPHVGGVAALAWSRRPAATVAEVRSVLLDTAQPHPSLVGRTVTGGTVNARQAVAAIAPAEPQEPAPSPEPSPTATPTPSPTATPTPSPTATPTPTPTAAPGSQDGADTAAPLTDGGGPAPALAPGVAVDEAPPALSVRSVGPRRRRALLRRGAVARVGCSEPCTLRTRLLAPRRTARRLGLRPGGRAVVLGRGRSGAGSGPVRIATRLSRRAARRIRRARFSPVVLRLVIRATDTAGNTSRARRTLRVRTGGGR